MYPEKFIKVLLQSGARLCVLLLLFVTGPVNAKGYETIMTSAEGRKLSFTVEPQPNGERIQRNTGADGSVQTRIFKPNGQEITMQPDGTVITVQEGPDPRFGMQSPIPVLTTIETPSDLTSTVQFSRSAVLSTPGDPLSLKTLAETTTVNGRAFRSVFQRETLTFTYTTPEGRLGTRTINDRSRATRTQINGLAPVDFSYDARGRLQQIVTGEDEQERITQLNYHASGPQKGFLQSIVDAEKRTFSFEYDAVERMTKQTLPDGRIIRYSYDPNDNITSITPPGKSAHTFEYNAFDLEATYTAPAVEGVKNTTTEYEYNLDKELIKITRPDGQTVVFNRNIKGQLASISIPRGNYNFSYNPTTGKLIGITAPGDEKLTYSHNGFLNTGTSWSGTLSGSVTQTYNNNFLINQRCINTNECVTFGYDDDSLLTNAGSLALTRDAQRGGLITGTALGDVSTALGYNAFGELESINAKYKDTQYFNTVFIRDKLGRITKKTEIVEGVATAEIYSYDLTGRLETVNRNDTITTYKYDSNSNRLSKTTGSNSETGTYDNQDRLLSYGGCSYEYTANGELTTKTCGSEVTTYDYDVLGNLLSVTLPNDTKIEYVIDGQDRRIGKKVDGKLMQGFLYKDQLYPVAELNADGSIRSRFIYADKFNVPAYMIRDGVTYRIVSDHLGNPRLVINVSDGRIVQRMDYDEFGNVITDTNPDFQPFGFAGGLYDPDTRLVRFGARDYSAEIGRWLSKDPILFDGSDVNLYEYVFSDPINFVDDNGEEPKSVNDNVNPTDSSGGSEHTKGGRESTRNKHEKGQTKRDQSRGGEKGDKNRRLPRKPPMNWRGPWPPALPLILCPLCPYLYPEDGPWSFPTNCSV